MLDATESHSQNFTAREHNRCPSRPAPITMAGTIKTYCWRSKQCHAAHVKLDANILRRCCMKMEHGSVHRELCAVTHAPSAYSH